MERDGRGAYSGLHSSGNRSNMDATTMAGSSNGGTSQSPKETGLWASLKIKFPILHKKRGLALLIGLLLLPLLGLLGLLALRNRNTGNGTITDDAHFYDQSEPVYPSAPMSGSADWTDAHAKAIKMVKQMTVDEKVSLTTGSSASNGCSGNIPAIAKLKFPGLCLSDAGNGLRATDFVSGWPSGVHVGASWNKNLASQRAAGMAGEFKKKGVNVLLGPVVGPIGRVVTGGRNWEGFSVDPYLAGALVSETVIATQAEGVITSTKHLIGNEQETNRVPHDDVEAVSSNIDDKTMHELYLWPFQDAVRAGTGNVMCSYNRVNNSYACANSKTQNGLLKEELGFQGFIVSDWGAQHSGVASALAGLDMAMPNSEFWGNKLKEAVNNGSVPESRLDDMATRIIATWYQMNQDEGFPDPGVGMPSDLTKPHKIVDARNKSSKATLLRGAIEGHVLLKNTRNALPLKKPSMLSIIGYSARSPDQMNVNNSAVVTDWAFGGESLGSNGFIGESFASQASEGIPEIALNGTIITGGGSGSVTPSIIRAPFEALLSRAYDDDTAVMWDLQTAAPYVDASSEACIVLGNAFASESFDRPSTHDDYTDGLILNVASQCNNTIVVLHNAWARLVDNFIDHDNITALIFAHLPGQESGPALTSILYGDTTPSGKLPYTVARNETDYGALLNADKPNGTFEKFPQSDFSEGVYVDYRHFDQQQIKPRFEFGFGLSYTTFQYADLSVKKSSTNATVAAPSYPTGRTVPGGPEDLWDVLATVSATVKNSGDVEGAEVAQLYVGMPEKDDNIPTPPMRQLRGFEKPFLNASQSTTVRFPLTRRDLSVWDVVAQKWLLRAGTYKIFVGRSSRDLPLSGNLKF